MTAENGRGANGQFVRTIEQIERDAQAARYKALGWSYSRLATHYKCTPLTAIRMVRRAREQAGKGDRDEALRLELVKLDAAEQVVLAVLAAKHVVVSNGRLVRLDGEPLPDDAPLLAAVDRWLRICERRAKLLGLDAPTKSQVTVFTEDMADRAIAELEAEMAARALSDG